MKDLIIQLYFQHPKTGERGSILDTPDSIDVDALTRNTAVIATSLLQHIYNTSVDEIFSEGLVSQFLVPSCLC